MKKSDLKELIREEIDSMIVFNENRKIVEAFNTLVSHLNTSQQKNKLSSDAIQALSVVRDEIYKLPR